MVKWGMPRAPRNVRRANRRVYLAKPVDTNVRKPVGALQDVPISYSKAPGGCSPGGNAVLKRSYKPVPVLHSDRNAPTTAQVELRRILQLQVPVIVKLAERKLPLSEVMRLGVGAIIEFVKSNEEPLELLISNTVIGTGETVKVGENFGLRITNIGDVKQVIRSMTS